MKNVKILKMLKYILSVILISSCLLKKEKTINDFWNVTIYNRTIEKINFNTIEFKTIDDSIKGLLYFHVYEIKDSLFVDSFYRNNIIVSSNPNLNYNKTTSGYIWILDNNIPNKCFNILNGKEINICYKLNSIIDSVLYNNKNNSLFEHIESIKKSKYSNVW